MSRAFVAAAWVALLSFTSRASAQGYAAAEAASHMTVPAGLEVKLFASEPMIAQPVCIEFDDRGRLWVIQYLQYPNPAGLKRVSVDRYSRTQYDHVPDPPPKGPRGADRITILEDTDGDGIPDKSHDFVNGLNITSGLAFGHGGVFVMNPPYLLFYPDKNRDDVPDGDPEVCLTGFGMEDCHSVANSLTFGPDGWLYGCEGSTVTSNIRGVEFQQGVWRYHPLTKKFELFCEGGGNSWGLDFDPHGNLLYNTNYGGYVMLHGVQGAYYWKSFGKHGPLHNPYAYGYFDHVPQTNFTGGHVGNGGVIYEGTGLPESFRGKFISNDLLGHAVRFHTLSRDGSSFKSAYAGALLEANDTWFAPSDMTIGPDGAIYVADWCDKRTAHPDPDADWDRSNGRVYRIATKGLKFDAGPDYSKLSSERLIGMLQNTDNWVSRKARRELMNRRDASTFPALTKMTRDGNLEALCALYVGGGLNEKLGVELLAHTNPDVRRWAVRFFGDEEKVSPEVSRKLADLAASEPDVNVRSQLASTAKRLKAGDALPIIENLLKRDVDSKDPHIPLLLWWAIERHTIDARDALINLFASNEAWKSSLARNVILPRLVRRYAAEGADDGLIACAALLDAAPDAKTRHDLIVALDQGVSERVSPVKSIPTPMIHVIDSLWTDDTTDIFLIRAVKRLHGIKALKRAFEVANDQTQSPELRAATIDLLTESGNLKIAESLLKILKSRGEPDVLKNSALAGLSRLDFDVVPGAVLKSYSRLSMALRPRIIDLLLSRPKWTVQLLDAVDAGKIAPTDVTVEQLRPTAQFHDKQLDLRIAKRWGKITGGTPGEKLAEVRRFNNDLRAAAGDPAAGKVLFTKTCAVCHTLFNDGGKVGPDLTHANRADRDYLLVSIVDPSAVVRAEFLSYLVKTTDGRVLTGLLVEQTPASITLVDSKAQRTTVERSKVKDLKESPVSLMPEGLLTQFKPQELRDLFAYLQSNVTGKSP